MISVVIATPFMLYPLNGGLNERAPHMDGREYTDTWKLELEQPAVSFYRLRQEPGRQAPLAGDGGERHRRPLKERSCLAVWNAAFPPQTERQ